MPKNNFLILFITLALPIILVFVVNVNGDAKVKDNFCLINSYNDYKKAFMSKDGRVIDPDKNNITTSEGQSYMLLRSLIMEDKPTFDLVYMWTKNNLQRQDNLFAWLWGKNSSGEYKILDYNSASDADVDIAFTLLLASEAWGQNSKSNDVESYLAEAIPIIQSIWNYETKYFGSQLVLMPGAAQTSSDDNEVNPSYFAPYAFKLFQKYDEKHDWNYLVNSSYYYLDAVMAKTDTHLPPNWFRIQDNQIILEDSSKSDFSYDAVRVFPRVYLDYIDSGESRALPVLEKTDFFVKKWIDTKMFYTNYKANGELRDKDEFIGAKAMLIPVISLKNKKIAKEMYKSKVERYIQDKQKWENSSDYYGKNLSWFGFYLYEKNVKGCEPPELKHK